MAKRKHGLEQSEVIFMVLSILVVFALVFSIINTTVNTWISSLNPLVQFLIFNLGLYAVFFLVIKGVALGKKRVWEGAMGTVLGFMAFDIILPEYHVTAQGLQTGGLFGASSSDYFFGYIYQALGVPLNLNLFGYQLPLLAIMVYVVTFVAMFLLGSYLIKDYVKELG
jgi:hypothetical protein